VTKQGDRLVLRTMVYGAIEKPRVTAD